MKKVILVFLVMALASVQVVLAADDVKVSAWAKKAFEKQFPNAQYAKWSELNNVEMYAVTFGYNEQNLLAYVDRSGIVVAKLRTVQLNNLPFPVQESITGKYAGYRVIKIEELSMNSELTYLVQIENGKKKIGLRVYPGGNLYEIRKEKIK